MRAETAGWTGGEDEEIQSKELTQLSWILISDPTRKMGQNEYYDKEDGAEWVLWQSLQSQISIPGLRQR